MIEEGLNPANHSLCAKSADWTNIYYFLGILKRAKVINIEPNKLDPLHVKALSLLGMR